MKHWMIGAILLAIPLAAQTPNSSQVYAAGATVSLAAFGLSLQVPPGWTAARQEQPGALMLANADGKLMGFLFLKTGVSPGEMKEFFADKTEGILRLEQATVAGYSNAWSFDFRDTEAGVIGTGRAVLGAGSTAALVLVMAKQGTPATLGSAAENWIRALRFASAERPQTGAQPPAGTPAANPFSGRQLRAVKTYRGGDFFQMTTINLNLCGDGTYSAIVKKESSSVSGLLGPSQNTTRETGTWSLAGAAPEWMMTLRTSEGASNQVALRNAPGLRFGDMPAELLQAAANCR